jgi:hypothetical protein
MVPSERSEQSGSLVRLINDGKALGYLLFPAQEGNT